MTQRSNEIIHYFILEPVSVVPEVILRVHGFVVEIGIFSALDDFVPQNNLKNNIEGRQTNE